MSCGCGGEVVKSTRGQQGPPGSCTPIVEILYADLATLKSTSSLIPATIYFITDKNIYVQALTTNGLEAEATLKATNADYNNVTTNFIGVWKGTTGILYDTLVGSFQVGEIVTGGTSGAQGEIIVKVAVNQLGQRIAQVISKNGTAFGVAETITGGTSGATANTLVITTTSILGTIATNKIVSWNNLHYKNTTNSASIKHPKYDTTNWTALATTDSSYQIEYDPIIYNFSGNTIVERRDKRGNIVSDQGGGSITRFQWGRDTVFNNLISSFGFENWNAATANSLIFCQDSTCYIGDTANVSFSDYINRSTVVCLGASDSICTYLNHSNLTMTAGFAREAILNNFANLTIYSSSANGGVNWFTNCDIILLGTSVIYGCNIDGGDTLLYKVFTNENHSNQDYKRSVKSTFDTTLSQAFGSATLSLTDELYGVYNVTVTGGAGSISAISGLPSFPVQFNLVTTNSLTFVNSASLILKGGTNKTFYPANKDWIIFQTITSVIQELNSSVGLSTPVLNTLFVSKSGNDTTGTSGRWDKPFLTIGAAQTAATSGQTIIIYPGTYSESNLGKSNINYHFINGAIFSCTSSIGFNDSGAISYSITGEGEFTCTSGSVANFVNGGVLTFSAKKASGTSGFIFDFQGASKLYATILKDIVSTTGRCLVLYNTSQAYISAKEMSSGGYAVCTSSYATTTCYLTADTITATGDQLFDTGGTFVVKGQMIYTGAGTAIGCTAGVACAQIFYGDLTNSASANCLGYANAVTGTLDFYGKITGTGWVAKTDTATYTFHNDLTTNVSTTSSINMTAGTVKVLGKITNSDVNAASYGVTKTVGTLILQNAVIVTSGGTESVHSVAAQNIKIYGTLVSNVALSGNITDLCGGVVQTDTDVS